MSHRGRGFIIHALAVTLAGVCASSAASQESTLPRQVREAFQSRQQRASAARFAWTEQTTYTKGGLFNPKARPDLVRKGRRKDELIPPEDVTFKEEYQLSLDGRQMRYNYEGHIWVASKSHFDTERFLSIYDGAVCKLFASNSSGHPVGVVKAESQNTESSNVHALPILINYRFMEPNIGIARDSKYTLLPGHGVIDGKKCLVLEDRSGVGGVMIRSLWLDPERDYSPLRYAISTYGMPTCQVDIKYKHDEKLGAFVPIGWSITRMTNDGKQIAESSNATVKEYSVGEAIEAKEFQLDFPAGTFVSDETEIRKGKKRQYIVQPDGNERTVTPQELARAKSYDELANPDSGRRTWRLITVSVLLVGAVLIFLVVRRRSQKRVV